MRLYKQKAKRKDFLKVIQLHKNEAKLINSAKKGQRNSQRVLFDIHAPKMLSICRYYIKDVQYAEDVMLKGFLKVFSNLNKFRNEGSFEGWIRRIMVNECISFLRQMKQVEFVTDDFSKHDEVALQTDVELETQTIQNLIDQLPEGYKIVFNMYALEGYKHHEIARILNISEGTSKSQLYKARKMLQQQLEKLNLTSNGTNKV